VHVDVLDAQVLGRLQEPVGAGVGQLVAPGAVVPLGGVELDALRAVGVDVLLELFQAWVAVAGIEPGVVNELARMPLPISALRSVVLKPSAYHSFRYVGWKTATST